MAEAAPAAAPPARVGPLASRRDAWRSPCDRRVLAALVAVLAAWLYLPSLGHGFVPLDDNSYVYENEAVLAGLSAEGWRYAWTTPLAGQWHPLTTLSLQLDAELFGASPGGFHLTNLLLHAAIAGLVVLALTALTAAPWRSAAVGALLAVHPTHVENVAWVSDRKDLVCGLFWALALLCWAGWLARRQRGWYLAALACHAMALLGKQVAVTLPCVLLLLDLWPARRLVVDGGWRVGLRSLGSLVAEKLPFLLLSVAVAPVATRAIGYTMLSWSQHDAGARFSTALSGYLGYLQSWFWPVGLAAFYPLRPVPIGRVVMAAVVLGAITALALVCWRRASWLLVGWIWFIVVIAPVSGLLQAGAAARADRYLYLPSIGLSVAIVWSLAWLAERWRAGRPIVVALIAVSLVCCIGVARRQLATWRDGLTLYRHAVEVTTDNAMAHLSYATMLLQKGNVAAAVDHGREAVRLAPTWSEANSGLGESLRQAGRHEESARWFVRATELDPADRRPRLSLAMVLEESGDLAGAHAVLARLVEDAPDFASAHYGLGVIAHRLGRQREARLALDRAAALDPTLPGLAGARLALADEGPSESRGSGAPAE